MSRSLLILALISVLVRNAAPQAIPETLLSAPARLELDKPTQETEAGSTVTYNVTLKDARGRAVVASRDLQLVVETPAGKQMVVLPAGQSSAKFTWQALKSGVTQMTVRSGTLRPATGLVLVAPPSTSKLIGPGRLPVKVQAPVGGGVGVTAKKATKPPAAEQPAQPVAAAAPGPPPVKAAAASEQAKKIRLYITPLPVFGNAIDHIWQASASVASLNKQDSLAPVSSDVNVHFNTSSGTISPSDIVLSAGQFSNFQNPALLTADHAGKGSVDVVSSLGPAGPIEIEFLLPAPTQLRVALGSPVLSSTGSGSVTVQTCLLDESGAVTSSEQDVPVTLTPSSGQLKSSLTLIRHNSSCSDLIEWNSAPGRASILAESSGLKSDTKNTTFPSFPWYLVWFAALGGLVGALVASSGRLLTAQWWSHTWRSLLIGALLGFVFYLLARFGAIVQPKSLPVVLQKIPVWTKAGSFILGFVGGVLGRKFWKV